MEASDYSTIRARMLIPATWEPRHYWRLTTSVNMHLTLIFGVPILLATGHFCQLFVERANSVRLHFILRIFFAKKDVLIFQSNINLTPYPVFFSHEEREDVRIVSL